MFLPLALLLAALILFAQLILCRKAKRTGTKLLPGILLLLAEAACWTVVFVEKFIPLPYGAAFAAYIYALILLVFLGADLLAWLLYILGKWFRRICLRRAGK